MAGKFTSPAKRCQRLLCVTIRIGNRKARTHPCPAPFNRAGKIKTPNFALSKNNVNCLKTAGLHLRPILATAHCSAHSLIYYALQSRFCCINSQFLLLKTPFPLAKSYTSPVFN